MGRPPACWLRRPPRRGRAGACRGGPPCHRPERRRFRAARGTAPSRGTRLHHGSLAQQPRLPSRASFQARRPVRRAARPRRSGRRRRLRGPRRARRRRASVSLRGWCRSRPSAGSFPSLCCPWPQATLDETPCRQGGVHLHTSVSDPRTRTGRSPTTPAVRVLTLTLGPARLARGPHGPRPRSRARAGRRHGPLPSSAVFARCRAERGRAVSPCGALSQ